MSLFDGSTLPLKAFISPHWFKFTIPREPTDTELDDICQELFGYRFSQFDRLHKCRDKYRDCHTLVELVSVYRQGWMDNSGTTCFDISGTGLDTLGLDISKLGQFALDQGGNICRIDLAALDTGNYLPFERMQELCMEPNFKFRIRTRFNRGAGNAPKIEVQPVRRIVFGSERSDNYLVIYDRQQTEKLDFPCVCIEQRITNRADCAAIIRALNEGEDPGPYFAGLLRGKIDFLAESNRGKRNKEPEAWWTDFLGDCERRKIKRTPRKLNPFGHRVRGRQAIEKARKRGDIEGLGLLAEQVDSAICALRNITF